MVLKEKLDAALQTVSAAKEAVAACKSAVKELDECIEQSKQSVLEIDKQRDVLKGLKAERVKVAEDLATDEKKLVIARTALAKLKEMAL